MKRKHKGFTIIELIVVMAVIGILVLLAAPKFMGHTKEAKYTRLISDTKNLETASERYYIDKQDWPRLSNEPYSAEQIEAFTQKIYDSTGKIIELDPEGKYYDIDYKKLAKYINVPSNKEQYIIQNPVGNIYALDDLTEEAKTRLTNIKAKTITLDSTNLNLKIGLNQKLTAIIKPDNVTNKSLKWISSDESVATVNDDGIVTGIGNGVATITVSSLDNSAIANCNVSVVTDVTGITLNKSVASVDIGFTLQLIANISPINASNKNIVWQSSDENIATIDSNGLIKGKAVGTVTITAITEDGSFVANCTISVSVPFTMAVFTTAGAGGLTGPTQSQLNNSYAGTELSGKVISKNGIQVWAIPKTGTYRIEAYGASGGTASGNGNTNRGGLGAVIKGDIYLTQGETLMILVGHPGNSSSYSSGGGGGTYVVRTVSSSAYKMYTNEYVEPLVVAGGGSGGKYTISDGRNAITGVGGSYTAYNGGGGSSDYAGGGGGFISNGINGGASFLNGGAGTNTTFGGGAFDSSGNKCGAGGGYSGGNGMRYVASGGGGSFIISSAKNVATSDGKYNNSTTLNGLIQNVGSWNSGAGRVVISYVGE